MIELREIDEDNFYDCLNLDAGLSEQGHVDSVEYSLAEAWSLRPYSYPKAIYQDSQLIGYVSLFCRGNIGQIINFLIDKEQQRKGLGRQAVQLCLDYLKMEHNVNAVRLPVHFKNVEARQFWESVGFQETNTIEDDYLYLQFTL